MRHNVYGRKLNRTTNQRKALFRSLAVALFTHGRIDTTEAKAKAVRPWIEKLVTRSKTNDLTSRRLLLSDLPNQQVVEKLLSSVGPAFTNRPGGYTRLTRLGNRFGDNAMIVRLEFVEEIKGLKEGKDLKPTKAQPEPGSNSRSKTETSALAGDEEAQKAEIKEEKTEAEVKKPAARRSAKKETAPATK